MSRIGVWRPGVVEKRTCPFSPCRSLVDVYRHAPSSDRLDEVVETIEQHAIEGPNSWYRVVCPASHLLIPFSEKGLQVLAEHERRFREAKAEREAKGSGRDPKAAVRLAAENRRIERRKKRGELGHLDRPAEEYFPTRPSDTEEAQEQYGPATAGIPAGVQMIPQGGRQSMTSANDTTINMVQLAKQTISAGQEDCSAATHLVGLVDSHVKSVQEHFETAGQVIAAAAMGSTVTPRAADEAATNIAQARHLADEAEAALAGFQDKLNDSFQAAHHAVEKLDEFLAQLSA